MTADNAGLGSLGSTAAGRRRRVQDLQTLQVTSATNGPSLGLLSQTDHRKNLRGTQERYPTEVISVNRNRTRDFRYAGTIKTAAKVQEILR